MKYIIYRIMLRRFYSWPNSPIPWLMMISLTASSGMIISYVSIFPCNVWPLLSSPYTNTHIMYTPTDRNIYIYTYNTGCIASGSQRRLHGSSPNWQLLTMITQHQSRYIWGLAEWCHIWVCSEAPIYSFHISPYWNDQDSPDNYLIILIKV